jgi:hypothetical protein
LVGIELENVILDSASIVRSKNFVNCARQIRQVGIIKKRNIMIFVICVMSLRKKSFLIAQIGK